MKNNKEVFMKLEKIQKIASKFKISYTKLSKPDLIKAIQKAEGNFDCFGTALGSCSQTNCLWHNDCLEKKTTR